MLRAETLDFSKIPVLIASEVSRAWRKESRSSSYEPRPLRKSPQAVVVARVSVIYPITSGDRGEARFPARQMERARISVTLILCRKQKLTFLIQSLENTSLAKIYFSSVQRCPYFLSVLEGRASAILKKIRKIHGAFRTANPPNEWSASTFNL